MSLVETGGGKQKSDLHDGALYTEYNDTSSAAIADDGMRLFFWSTTTFDKTVQNEPSYGCDDAGRLHRIQVPAAIIVRLHVCGQLAHPRCVVTISPLSISTSYNLHWIYTPTCRKYNPYMLAYYRFLKLQTFQNHIEMCVFRVKFPIQKHANSAKRELQQRLCNI